MSEGMQFGYIAALLFLALIFAGSRIPVAAFVSGFIGALGFYGWENSIISTVGHAFAACDEYTITVIPMFLFMGYLAYYSGLGDEVYRAARAWIGRLPAGLAIATTFGCAGFGAMTGSSTSAAIMFTKLSIPEMDKYKYSRRLSIGCVAASGTLAVLIPPSVAVCIYGLITEQSIGRLLIAGFVPGIMSAFLMALMMYLMARFNPGLAPPGPSFPWKERLASVRGLWAVVLIIGSILAGLYLGVFTPTEAGALGSFAMLCVVAIRRKLSWYCFKSALLETARMCGIVFVMLVGIRVLMIPLVGTGITNAIVQGLLGISSNPYVILMFIILIFVVFGCFISGIGMMMTTVPFMFPVVMSLGFDPIWFGIIVVVAVEIGLFSPPVGPNVYVTCRVADEPLEKGFLAVLPFMLLQIAIIGLLIAFPQIILFVPSHM